MVGNPSILIRLSKFYFTFFFIITFIDFGKDYDQIPKMLYLGA